jgi:signal transduction histidine kinase
MKLNGRSPGLLMVLLTLLCLAVSGLVMSAATSQPELGLQLAASNNHGGVLIRGTEEWLSPGIGQLAGTRLLAIGPVAKTANEARPPPFGLLPEDLVESPETLGTQAALDNFLRRQEAISALLHGPVTLYLHDPPAGVDAAVTVSPRPRPVLSLPSGFWVQLLTGVSCVLIAGWVWSARPRTLAPSLFLASAIGLLLSTASSAIFANRGLALPAEMFRTLLAIDNFGLTLFNLALIGLFLVYPTRMVRPVWLWILPVLLAALTLCNLAGWTGAPDQVTSFIGIATLVIIATVGAQWVVTRRNPADRAALGWLALSVTVGCSAYIVIGVTPILFDMSFGVSQSHAIGLLLVIYVGLALGLNRFRLFEMGDWAYRVLFYTLGTLLLVVIDALLVTLLSIDSAPALALSILTIGFVYLPLRDVAARNMSTYRNIKQHELFSAAIDVAFAPSAAERTTRWQLLLRRVFDPIKMSEADDIAAVSISSDGQSMHVPAVAGSPALHLSCPFAGRGLFSQPHQQLAHQLVTLVARAEDGREAYIRGVGEERRRMARDLHDDVGARLLSGLHTADPATRPMLQAALMDIRAIVSGLSGEQAPLDRVLAEIRYETARRLEAADIALDWPLPDPDLAMVQLDYRLHKALTSAVREIISNIIRHSGAARVVVSLDISAGSLALDIADDGAGLPATAIAGQSVGYGLRNLRHRIEDLGGTLSLGNSTPGTTISLDIPLVLTERPPKPDALGQPLSATRRA